MPASLRRASGLCHIETKPGGFLNWEKNRIRANWYYLTWAKAISECPQKEKWCLGILDTDQCDVLALNITIENLYLSKDLDHAIVEKQNTLAEGEKEEKSLSTVSSPVKKDSSEAEVK